MSNNSTASQITGDHRAFSRFGFLSVAVALGGLGIFAARAPLDSAAIAPGRVATESNTKPIQHLEGGIVREILVKEQAFVKEGQVLFRLEPTQARASSEMLKGQIDAGLAQEARLAAERDSAPSVTYPDTLDSRRSNPLTAAAIADQDRQFAERRASLDNQSLILQSRVEQAANELDGLVREEATLKTQALSFGTEIANVTGLEKNGFYPKNKLLALQREESKVQGQLAALQGDMARKSEAIGEARLQLKQVEQTYREQASGQLTEVRARVADLSEKLRVADDVMSRVEIRAPQDGIVQGIKVHAAGAVIRPGDQIAELVPAGDNLVMAARVSPLDIASILPGQTAEVRFSAFSSRQMPIIVGHVKTVGADTMVDEVTHLPYYSALVIVDPKELPEAVQGKLVPGMPASVLISTGERTLLQYLISPVTNLLATSMRER